MSFFDLITGLSDISISFFIKLMVYILFLFYVIFAFVIVRQEQLMNKVVETEHAVILRFFALVHFFTALTVFLLALLFL